ncbi:MAG: hypothetical protein V1926_04905 [Candidatus Peregrinibacteria bacterium]
MKAFLSYLFWPNPGHTVYQNPKVLLLLCAGALLIVLSFIFRVWRNHSSDVVACKLSRSWSVSCFWFGIVALILTVSRVEQIQFLAMRFLWVLWGLSLLLYAVIQFISFRRRYYHELPKVVYENELEKYLPKRRKH